MYKVEVEVEMAVALPMLRLVHHTVDSTAPGNTDSRGWFRTDSVTVEGKDRNLKGIQG